MSMLLLFHVLCVVVATVSVHLLNYAMWVCSSIGICMCYLLYSDILWLHNIDGFYNHSDVNKMWIKLGRTPLKVYM